GCGQEPLDGIYGGLLHDQLRPNVNGGKVTPPVVDLFDIHRVFHVHEFQEMEQEQRYVRVRARGHIRHRRSSGNTRIDFAEVYLVGVEVDQDVDLKEAAVAFLCQPIAHLTHVADRSG